MPDRLLDKLAKEREERLNEMMKNGELSTMTECAYGEAIADTEFEDAKKKKKKEEITD